MGREEQRQAFRAKAESRHVPVKVEGVDIGGDVYAVRLGFAESSKIRRAHPDDDGEQTGLRLMAASLCQANGEPLFDPHDDADIEIVGGLDASFFNAVTSAIRPVAEGKDSAQTTSS